MSESELARRILAHVNRPNYRPVKPRVIAKQLNLPKDEHVTLKREVKRLVKSGKLAYAANHLVEPVAARNRNEVIGVFRRAAAGYGFVRPASAAAQAGRREDIFIPAARTRDAADGDTVRVRYRQKATDRPGQRRGRPARKATSSDDQRLRGEVIEIVKRSRSQFVGTYHVHDGAGFVQVDGTDFDTLIYVGDPGAKGARENDKVVIEMVQYPTSKRNGEGVITEVLGERGKPGVDTLTVLREFALPTDFPEDVLDDARRQADLFDEQISEGRRDLTDMCVVTIDPFDARDFDDAISLEQLENGHWRLGVHIADVSHFVPRKSALDREARDRATSVYLPDRVIPMLPEVISNHLASLQPDRVRYVMTAFIEYTADGALVATEFARGAIRSQRRFTYEEVDQYLADAEPWRSKLTDQVFQLLAHMHTLAMILRSRRLDNGSIEMSLPEVKIELDADGRVCGAHRVEHTESHQMIEEFMLAANQAVAQRFRDEELVFLRRIHESPDELKLTNLAEFVRELGIDCDDLESRFEIKRVLEEVADTGLAPAVNYAVLRAMRKAVYSPQDVGHYALAIQNYCHFTSPIRRYPDLTIHRLMLAVLENRPLDQQFDHVLSLGEHCSEREQRAESAERELTKLKLLNFLADKIGEQLDVVVTGVEEFGLFAVGIELPVEGLLHINSLQDDRYHFDSVTRQLIGFQEANTFRLGDRLRARIHRVDLDRRELDFTLVERLTSAHETLNPFAPTSPAAPAGGGADADRVAGERQGRRDPSRRKPRSESRTAEKSRRGRKGGGRNR